MTRPATPTRRRRHGILLETIEQRLLFDASPAAAAVMPIVEPVDSISPDDLSRSLSDARVDSQSYDSQLPMLNVAETQQTDVTVPPQYVASEAASEASPLAFPGASGFGALAQGGRGGDVYHVTNLNDGGAGSLRFGIESAIGPRNIVFDVSGTIELQSRLVIDTPFLTIAGQTAPGQGITLRNHGTWLYETHDVILRYLRFRPGDTAEGDHDSLVVYKSQDVMIDHVSASWSVDEVLDTSGSSNVTVQWSIISEGLNQSRHSKGPHSAGSIHEGGSISFHHNLFAHNLFRNPFVRQQADIVNNVIYNWTGIATMAGWSGEGPDPHGETRVNLQGNYYLVGPSTENADRVYRGYGDSQLWADNNVLDDNKNGILDAEPTLFYSGTSRKVDTRFDFPSVPTDDPHVAFSRVLSDAGASRVRDSVDNRLVQEVVTQTGSVIDSPTQVGGWPKLESTAAPADHDRDGMPNDWEQQFSYLNSADPGDAALDDNDDGYTNLEDFLRYIASGERPLEVVEPAPAPEFRIAGPNNLRVGQTGEFEFEATSSETSDSYRYDIDWNGDGVVDQKTHGALGIHIQHAFDVPGTFAINVTLTDPRGDQTKTSHPIAVEVIPPDIRIVGPPHVIAGQVASISVSPGSTDQVDNEQPYSFSFDWNSDGRVDEIVSGQLGMTVHRMFQRAGRIEIAVGLTGATEQDFRITTFEVDVLPGIHRDPAGIRLSSGQSISEAFDAIETTASTPPLEVAHAPRESRATLADRVGSVRESSEADSDFQAREHTTGLHDNQREIDSATIRSARLKMINSTHRLKMVAAQGQINSIHRLKMVAAQGQITGGQPSGDFSTRSSGVLEVYDDSTLTPEASLTANLLDPIAHFPVDNNKVDAVESYLDIDSDRQHEAPPKQERSKFPHPQLKTRRPSEPRETSDGR